MTVTCRVWTPLAPSGNGLARTSVCVPLLDDWDTLLGFLIYWQDENNASTEEAAVHYLQNNQDTWGEWLNDSARENLSELLEQ